MMYKKVLRKTCERNFVNVSEQRHYYRNVSKMILVKYVNLGPEMIQVPPSLTTVKRDCTFISRMLKTKQSHRGHINYSTAWPISSFLSTNSYIVN